MTPLSTPLNIMGIVKAVQYVCSRVAKGLLFDFQSENRRFESKRRLYSLESEVKRVLLDLYNTKHLCNFSSVDIDQD